MIFSWVSCYTAELKTFLKGVFTSASVDQAHFTQELFTDGHGHLCSILVKPLAPSGLFIVVRLVDQNISSVILLFSPLLTLWNILGSPISLLFRNTILLSPLRALNAKVTFTVLVLDFLSQFNYNYNLITYNSWFYYFYFFTDVTLSLPLTIFKVN